MKTGTGAHLKIKRMGDKVLGVELEGNPQKPEPDHFRVVLPFGDVDITRCTDNTYWVHVRIDTDKDGMHVPGDPTGKLIDGRVDVRGKHAGETDAGDFKNPDAYHVAVRLGPNN